MSKNVILVNYLKKYSKFQTYIRLNYYLIDNIKLYLSILILIIIIWIYWYFINITSTKWFFLRKEMKNLNDSKFVQNIYQIEALKKEKQIWENLSINQTLNEKKIKIKQNVVYIHYSNDDFLTKK